jgi:hypothetical protein
MPDTFPNGSLQATFNPQLAAAIQDRTLQRTFRDQLYPNLLWRMEAEAEMWAMHLGGSATFTRVGPMEVIERPSAVDDDPVSSSYGVEQWEVTAQQWKNSIDTSMPTSYISIASQYLRNVHQLGLNAGISLNRVVRNKLYNSYVSGNTVTDVAASATDVTIHVVNLPGFTQALSGGRPLPVSASNPIPISIPAISYTGNVTAVTPDTSGDTVHGGTLTITPALPANLAARSAVLADKRSVIVYAGGGTSVDSIDASDRFSVRDIRTVIAQMRADNIPTHDDGLYHWHLGPQSENQVFEDNEFQRLNQSMPDFVHYRRFALAIFGAGVFYRNNEVPSPQTCGTGVRANTHGFELFNGAGLQIERPICTGAEAIDEKYIDESQYISAAGVMGKIGEFSVVNGGVQVVTERIRLIMRAPIDKAQQLTTATWTYSGDWGIPTNELGQGASRASYRNCRVVAHSV